MSDNLNGVNLDILLYKRLIFEISVLRQELHNAILNETKNIQILKKQLKATLDNFYIISSNLLSQ